MTLPGYDSLVEPAIFWLWNDTPSPDGIRQRLDSLRDRGIRALYIHPMPEDFRREDFHGGLQIPYLSPEYFELIALTCEEMKRRGMILWLYDEGGWPSGSANGAVVRENSAFGAWALERHGSEFQPVQFLDVHSYPDLMNADATRCFIQHTHEKYRCAIGDEFGGTVKGIFTDEPRLMGRVGSAVIPWSPLLPDAFEAQHGYALESIVPLLFAEADDAKLGDDEKLGNAGTQKTVRAQRDYLQVMSTLVATNYYAVLSQWCQANGLLFEGHHSGEDEWSRHGQYFGHFLQQARHYDVPGVDAIWRQVFPGAAGGNYLGLASSSSWLRGQRVALSECGAVYGAGLTLEQLRWITSFHIVRGVNKLAFMSTLENARSSRRVSLCGTDFSSSSPIWKHADLLFDYARRAAQFSVSGQARPSIGVFYRGELVDLDQCEAFDQAHEALCERLHDAMAGVLFLGADDLKAASVENSVLQVGEMRLSLLVLHVDAPLDALEKQLLHRLVDEGACLLWVGNQAGWNAFRDDVLEKTEAHHAQWIEAPEADELIDILSGISPFRIDEDLRGVRVLPLQDQERWRYLLFNQNLAPITFRLRLKCGHALREFPLEDKVSGESSFLHYSNNSYCLSMQPGEMLALETLLPGEKVLGEGDQDELNLGGARPTKPDLYDSSEDRQLEIALDSWHVLEETSFVIREDVEIDTADETQALPLRALPLGDYSVVNPHFSGTLLFETVFNFEPKAYGRVLLDLQQVFYCVSVQLNGRDCGRRAWSPFVFDVTPALRQGKNRLQIRVTNTLANQWARPDVRRRDFQSSPNMYLEKSSPFIDESCHAGLGGPVVLKVFNH